MSYSRVEGLGFRVQGSGFRVWMQGVELHAGAPEARKQLETNPIIAAALQG